VNDLTEVKIRTGRPSARSEFVRLNAIRARRNNPCATLQRIGDRFGITRERVRQILKEAGKSTVSWRPTYICQNCGKEMLGNNRQVKTFCSKKCWIDYHQVPIECEMCGEIFYVRQSIVLSKHKSHNPRFCSNTCQGKWLGENYGKGKQCKWDWSRVYELRDSTGWGAIRIGRALDIPFSTVNRILSKRYKTK